MFDSASGKKNPVLLLLHNQMHIVRCEFFISAVSASVEKTSSAIFVSNIFALPLLFDFFSAVMNEGKVLWFFLPSKSIMPKQIFSLPWTLIALSFLSCELFHVHVRQALWIWKKLINWFFTQYPFVFILSKILFSSTLNAVQIFDSALYWKILWSRVLIHKKIKFSLCFC